VTRERHIARCTGAKCAVLLSETRKGRAPHPDSERFRPTPRTWRRFQDILSLL
jgi:hypothetical protein